MEIRQPGDEEGKSDAGSMKGDDGMETVDSGPAPPPPITEAARVDRNESPPAPSTPAPLTTAVQPPAAEEVIEAPNASEPIFEAIRDVAKEKDGDLAVSTGEQFTVLATRSDGWWRVKNKAAVVGLVPSNCLVVSLQKFIILNQTPAVVQVVRGYRRHDRARVGFERVVSSRRARSAGSQCADSAD